MKLGEISKRRRIAVVLSIIWICVILAIDYKQAYWRGVNGYGEILSGFNYDMSFVSILLGFGVLPLFLFWAITWIRSAPK
jgi:hypothetical protein